MTRDTAERARECHYELFRWDGPHYCHLPPEHEGGHEWFYTRKQVTQIQAEARLAQHQEDCHSCFNIKEHHPEWGPSPCKTAVRLRAALAQALQPEEKEGK